MALKGTFVYCCLATWIPFRMLSAVLGLEKRINNVVKWRKFVLALKVNRPLASASYLWKCEITVKVVITLQEVGEISNFNTIINRLEQQLDRTCDPAEWLEPVSEEIMTFDMNFWSVENWMKWLQASMDFDLIYRILLAFSFTEHWMQNFTVCFTSKMRCLGQVWSIHCSISNAELC